MKEGALKTEINTLLLVSLTAWCVFNLEYVSVSVNCNKNLQKRKYSSFLNTTVTED